MMMKAEKEKRKEGGREGGREGRKKGRREEGKEGPIHIHLIIKCSDMYILFPKFSSIPP
jgi:hypothetical protein